MRLALRLLAFGLSSKEFEWAMALRDNGFGFFRARRAARALAREYWGSPCECGLPCALCTALHEFQDAIQRLQTGSYASAAEAFGDSERHAGHFAKDLGLLEAQAGFRAAADALDPPSVLFPGKAP